ncbi:MAG: S24 family peptidase [Gammaproteobacteria bacterium]
MAIGETRRANLRWLIDTEFDGVDAKLAKRVGLHPSQVSRALSVSSGAALGNRLARRIEAKAEKPEGWMDEVHLFSEGFSQKLSSTQDKAIVVSPFGHKMVAVISYELAAEWIGSRRPYPITDRTQVEWVRLERASDRAIGVVVEDEAMMDAIGPGDHVFLDPELEPQPGDYVLATLDDEKKVVFRKYRPRQRDREGVLVVELAPINEDYPTYVIDSKHTGRILGVMVEHRKYRRRNVVRSSVPVPKTRRGSGE